MLSIFNRILIALARRELRGRRGDFYYDLGMTLEDKVPLFTTLRKYEARARERSPMQVPMFRQMLRGMQSGSLSKALHGVASDAELVLLDAIQGAGDLGLANGLKFMASTVEKTDAMLEVARKALEYPVGLVIMFAAMLTGFSLKVVPTLSEVLPPNEWPAIGQLLYGVSQIISNYGVYIAGCMIVLFFLFLYSLPRWVGVLRTKFDKFPPYSLYRDYSGAMLIVSVSSMMRTGISLRSSIERSMKHSTPWMRWHLREILQRLSRPKSIHFGSAFQTGVLSQYLEDRVQDASERSDPIEAFVKIGVGSIDQLTRTIERSAAKLNSVLMVVCGLILAFMMAGFFATAMELQTGIQKMSTRGAPLR